MTVLVVPLVNRAELSQITPASDQHTPGTDSQLDKFQSFLSNKSQK